MPLVDRHSRLTPQNMRNADVAHHLTEYIAPQQQAKMMSAFRVQGIEAILLSKLTQGRPCTCVRKNNEVIRLDADGKASTGAINRAVTGHSNFGISDYDPGSRSQDEFSDIYDDPTSPRDALHQWLGDLNQSGVGDGDPINQAELEPTLGDQGQFSPDLEDLLQGFDMGHLGLSDVSCPICFGTSYVGGYSPFRGWRHVIVPSELETDAYLDLSTFALSPGTHSTTVTLPRGAIILDAFRTFNGDKVTQSRFWLDNEEVTTRRVLDKCDGRPHKLVIVTEEPLTHMEMQAGLSHEPVYFEIPKLTKSSDLSLLEQQEPFQILLSPDIPHIQTMDIILESQRGKVLVVQNGNPWNTRNQNMLGFEAQVRVAQPQELWRILPFRRHITGQKSVRSASPSKQKATSGVVPARSFQF